MALRQLWADLEDKGPEADVDVIWLSALPPHPQESWPRMDTCFRGRSASRRSDRRSSEGFVWVPARRDPVAEIPIRCHRYQQGTGR